MRAFLLVLISTITLAAQSQPKSPEDFLGYTLGSRFTRHHQVIAYFDHLGAQSPRVQVKPYGESYEKRPLILAFVSTEENLERLETIREDNLKRAGLMQGSPSTEVSIVWLSYNVHGNESASTEAALATAYELIRENKRHQNWLENTVVVIDPCVNPDGRERYVNFYWEHGNQPYNPDPAAWEHHEGWPGGRTNHYLFDLNRDWAWQTQVESRQRIIEYNRWLPHIHVDFHEQGINEPYYFAPAAEPFHELITDWQRQFQLEIGKNHARYFDKNNWFYFTRQYFDLLYPSYGDTYPMYNGAIGMTYEQGGSGRAGLGVIKQEGDTLTLKDRLEHHLTTGLSTIEMASGNNPKILREFQRFFHQSSAHPFQTYVMKYRGEDDAFRDLKTWLNGQGIRYGTAKNQKGLKGYHYGSGEERPFTVEDRDLVISANQPKSVLTTVLFEPRTKLADSVTYDITAWALPYVYGLEAYATSTPLSVSEIKEDGAENPGQVSSVYGFIFEWKSLRDTSLLTALLRKGVVVRYTTKPLKVNNRQFDRGSFIATRRDNPKLADFEADMLEISHRYGEVATPVTTGFMVDGPDIGSDEIRYLKPPDVAIISGEGTSSLNFGAIWHFFEQDLAFPVTIISTEYLDQVDLSKYEVLIMPDGSYHTIDNDTQMKRIGDWVSNGGKLIAIQGAIRKLSSSKTGSISEYNSDTEKTRFEELSARVAEEIKLIPKEKEERYRIRNYVAGAIFKVSLDHTHPLAYGYTSEYFSLKTTGDRYGLLPSDNAGIIRSGSDHLSGFAGSLVLEKVDQSLVFGVEQKGSGLIVYLVDDPLFRSFWQAGKLLFVNAVFYVGNR